MNRIPHRIDILLAQVVEGSDLAPLKELVAEISPSLVILEGGGEDVDRWGRSFVIGATNPARSYFTLLFQPRERELEVTHFKVGLRLMTPSDPDHEDERLFSFTQKLAGGAVGANKA